MNHDTSIRSQLPISTGNCRRNTINSLLFLLSLSQISLASNTHSDHTFKPVYRTTPLSFEKKCSLCLPLYLSWLLLPRVSFLKKIGTAHIRISLNYQLPLSNPVHLKTLQVSWTTAPSISYPAKIPADSPLNA